MAANAIVAAAGLRIPPAAANGILGVVAWRGVRSRRVGGALLADDTSVRLPAVGGSMNRGRV